MTDRTEALDIEAIDETAELIRRAWRAEWNGELGPSSTTLVADAALDVLLAALKASNEERERVRATLERIAYIKVVHTDVGELNTYTLVEVKRMAEAAISPERSDEGTE